MFFEIGIFLQNIDNLMKNQIIFFVVGFNVWSFFCLQENLQIFKYDLDMGVFLLLLQIGLNGFNIIEVIYVLLVEFVFNFVYEFQVVGCVY